MYTLKTIRTIEEAMGDYVLPEHVFSILETLTQKVGGNTALMSRGKMTKESLNGLLNKLTTDTYLQISTKVMNSNPTQATIDTLFKVAGGNMFYSKVYARLCNQIVELKEALRPCVLEKCAAHLLGLEGGDQEAMRERGLTLFTTNLALNGCIPMDTCVEMARTLQTKVEENLDGDEETVSAYVDHLTVVLTQNKVLTDSCKLEARVRSVSEVDTKKHKGVSLKVVFKCMDILDHFK